MVLLSKWRRISAVLLQQTYGQSGFSDGDPRKRSIQEARVFLDSILRPYVKVSSDNDERLRKLEDLLKRVARFGYLLFSQPSYWKFDWEDDRNAPTERLVIFPGLLQVTDDDGRPLKKPRSLEEKEVIEFTGLP